MHADPDVPGYRQPRWGVGAVWRHVNVPFNERFATHNGETTVSFIPTFYYNGEHLYFDGTELGYRADIADNLSLAAFTRLRLADFPENRQNEYQDDGYDPGVKLRYTFTRGQYADLELMTDMKGNAYGNFTYEHTFYWNDLDLMPYATASYKSSGFNMRYYGLERESLDSGIDLALGMDIWYHLYSNFYLYGKIQTKFLNSGATKSTYIGEDRQNEYWLGFAFRDDKDKPEQTQLQSKPYFRLAYGFATTANLGEILVGDTIPDKFNNTMSSLFYGYPLSDTFFNFPVSIYLTPGVVWHHTSEVQDTSEEFVLALKAYYTIPLPWRVRLGVATGISYVTNITYIENADMDPGIKSSKLLEHLGFSADISLEDIFGDTLDGLWLGYDIHHRSAVFKSASEYGNFKGGSNYNTVYLQYHF
ncbi:hypothetical protein YH65_08005 [Sulfurovum lithotrophicum]|uniref:MltA-interacting MipA family protein n=1 Tax=Sulfurovum lithotrophicum TaxID=206403 RepID=A0A7U4M358_9BACT|nr:hypothetical protein YH65_08005 [Sulfurovum lithotrophicum]